MSEGPYKRVLLKVSGEALMGDRQFGLDMPTLDAIPIIEKQTGKPVTSSTQALFWRSMRTAGIADEIKGAGRLLSG